jgi:hypothetical protein
MCYILLYNIYFILFYKMNSGLLNDIAFDIVKDKVIEDKMKEYTAEEEAKMKEAKEGKTTSLIEQGQENPEFPEIDQVDSEEERIIQKEIQRRKEVVDKDEVEKQKKALLKYGQYKEIIETEFLDIMLKNQLVVCHFYHRDFERCKIMDKHLKIIAEAHPETFFVKIDAEKTPFFTEKLQIKVFTKILI